MTSIACKAWPAVIDLGGDNTYEEGTTSLERPVLPVVNLGGGNVFRGTKPGIQGGASWASPP